MGIAPRKFRQWCPIQIMIVRTIVLTIVGRTTGVNACPDNSTRSSERCHFTMVRRCGTGRGSDKRKTKSSHRYIFHHDVVPVRKNMGLRRIKRKINVEHNNILTLNTSTALLTVQYLVHFRFQDFSTGGQLRFYRRRVLYIAI